MGLEAKEKEIGGLTFEVTQLPYFAAQRLFVRLIKLLGPGLLGLAQIAGSGGGKAAVVALGNADVGQLVPMLSSLFEKLDPSDMEDLTRKILETTRVRYQDKWVMLVKAMDTIIGGDFWTGMAVQAFALSVHFGNFSGARGVLDALGLKAKASNSEGSSTSTAGPDVSLSGPGGLA